MEDRTKYSNPFIFKRPVKGDYFFGRDDLLEKMFDYINAGESVSLVGERRTGKTSILLRVLDLKEQLVRQPSLHIFALLDFLGLDYHSEKDIWVTLLNHLSTEISREGQETETIARAIEQLRSEELIFETLLGLFRALANGGLKITFLFDEFEATAQEKRRVDISFYKILRNLASDKETRLTYVIATRQELSKVERSLEPEPTPVSSPFYNIFSQLVIPPFSENEAQQLISGLLRSTDLNLDTKLGFWLQRDLLFHLSGFHPFFLQIACYQLFEHCLLPDGTFSDQVPEDEIASAFLNEANSNFGYYWDISSVEEQELMRQLAMVEDDVDIQSYHPALNSLKNRCLIARDVEAKSGWRLFSSAFMRWIQDQQLATWYDEGITQFRTRKLKQARATFQEINEYQPDYRNVANWLHGIEEESKPLQSPRPRDVLWALTTNRKSLALTVLLSILIALLALQNVGLVSLGSDEMVGPAVVGIAPTLTPTLGPLASFTPTSRATPVPQVTESPTPTATASASPTGSPIIHVEPPAPQQQAQCGTAETYRFGLGIYNDSNFSTGKLLLGVRLGGDVERVEKASCAIFQEFAERGPEEALALNREVKWFPVGDIIARDNLYIEFEILISGDERASVELVAGVALEEYESRPIRGQASYYIFHCTGVTPPPVLSITPEPLPTPTPTPVPQTDIPCPLTMEVSIGDPECINDQVQVPITLNASCGLPPYIYVPAQQFTHTYVAGMSDKVYVEVFSSDGQHWSAEIVFPAKSCE